MCGNWMVRGAAVLIGDGMMKVDTQSHRTTRVANHDLTWASTRSPSTAYCPPDAFAGLFKHIFWRRFGLMVPGSVMAWQWRSGRRRIASNASPAGHVPAEGLGYSMKRNCRNVRIVQNRPTATGSVVEELIETRPWNAKKNC